MLCLCPSLEWWLRVSVSRWQSAVAGAPVTPSLVCYHQQQKIHSHTHTHKHTHTHTHTHTRAHTHTHTHTHTLHTTHTLHLISFSLCSSALSSVIRASPSPSLQPNCCSNSAMRLCMESKHARYSETCCPTSTTLLDTCHTVYNTLD